MKKLSESLSELCCCVGLRRHGTQVAGNPVSYFGASPSIEGMNDRTGELEARKSFYTSAPLKQRPAIAIVRRGASLRTDLNACIKKANVVKKRWLQFTDTDRLLVGLVFFLDLLLLPQRDLLHSHFRQTEN